MSFRSELISFSQFSTLGLYIVAEQPFLISTLLFIRIRGYQLDKILFKKI